MPSKLPTEDDRLEVLRRLLAGLAAGDEVPDIAGSMWELHPKDNTFPGEVFMALARDAMDTRG
ncbi:MAG TPA: hypothetical protein VEI83_04055 [Acidimicrobiales bacterium]|nr:hypothetical protein [Acidimicrobiales bacterium]